MNSARRGDHRGGWSMLAAALVASLLLAETLLETDPSTASPVAASQPAPLPGFPSCDYSRWRVVGKWEGAERGTWSPDGSRFVMGNRIIDADSGEVVREIRFEATVFRPSWSPDGRSIVFDAAKDNPSSLVGVEGIEGLRGEGEGNDLWAYDLSTGKLSRLTEDINGSNNFARFAHRTRRPPARRREHAPRRTRVTWVRSGLHGETRFIPMVGDLVRDPDGDARLVHERPLVRNSTHPAYGAFNRIGEFAAEDEGVLLISTRSNSGNGDVWRIDLATRKWTNLTAEAPSWEEHPRASPNGQKISFISTRDHPQTVNAGLEVSRAAGVPASLDNALIVAYAFGFAGLPVFAFSGEQYLANPDGSDPQSLTFGTEHGIEAGWFSRGAEFSPDGTRLALAQRPVSHVNVPGLPPNAVRIPGGRATAGRDPRTLVLAFKCSRTVHARLSLRLREVRESIQASVRGRDVGVVRRVDFLVGGRRLARDSARPFARILSGERLGERGVVKVRARVTFESYRQLTLARRVRVGEGRESH